jgi:hypothetical protein
VKQERKIIKLLYDYMCWNYKLISTEEFLISLKKLENYIFESELFIGKGLSDKIKISLGNEKRENEFDELDPKISIYKEPERIFMGNEEIMTASDIVKGNTII